MVLKYSKIALACSSLTFWLPLAHPLASFSNWIAIGSSFIICSGFIIIFITHSGERRSKILIGAGPINFLVGLWQAAQSDLNNSSP